MKIGTILIISILLKQVDIVMLPDVHTKYPVRITAAFANQSFSIHFQAF
jgi:hypothetical protein